MKAGVLFSGGKDSALAALLLSPFAQIELVTVSFGVMPNDAATLAQILGFRHVMISLEKELAMTSITTMIKDGYPNRGLNQVHKTALERAAECYRFVADGTRRDDKAPLLTLQEARSFEDRMHVDYIRPLLGYGRRTIDRLATELLEVIYGECISFDYEVELRQLMGSSFGYETVNRVFPKRHLQSKVTGRKITNFRAASA
jgi:predicted subunit of tRNA(5-methylaminomethyl-2-thiouridylate) methyltransferase